MEKFLELDSIEYDGITKEHFFPISYHHETSFSSKVTIGYGEDFKIEKATFSLSQLESERSIYSVSSTLFNYSFKLSTTIEYFYDDEKGKLLIFECEEPLYINMVVPKNEKLLQNTREDYLITSAKVVKQDNNEVIYGVNIVVALGEIDDN